MDMHNTVDLKHVHMYSMDMQHGHAVLTSSVDMQQENVARTCSMVMYGQAAWTYVDMQHRHKAWARRNYHLVKLRGHSIQHIMS